MLLDCNDCSQSLPLLDFYTTIKKSGVTGVVSHVCKKCVSARCKVRYLKNKEAMKSNSLAYYRENRDRINTGKREDRRIMSEISRGLVVARNGAFRHNDWTIELYDQALISQNGLCAVKDCKRKLVAADHCHETKKPRALLCSQCNAALGLLRDNPKRIRGLATYISYWNKKLQVGPRD